ncbi:MAG: hypothetical protein HC875_38635 [Anaerolineales bacterium]|nr:hypothetical protein [Anaerolineales bacterium]
MTTQESSGSSSVSIGNVSGGIHGSIIAGRDIISSTANVGQSSDKPPTVDELKQLLAQIQQELAKVTAQKETLQQISSMAPLTAQAAEVGIQEAASKVEGEVNAEQAESVQKSLTEATDILSKILDGAKTVAEKAGEVGSAVKPIAETLAPLVEKLALAGLWVGRLWLG